MQTSGTSAGTEKIRGAAGVKTGPNFMAKSEIKINITVTDVKFKLTPEGAAFLDGHFHSRPASKPVPDKDGNVTMPLKKFIIVFGGQGVMEYFDLIEPVVTVKPVVRGD